MRSSAALVFVLAACSVGSGCGGGAAASEASLVARRSVAHRFAQSIFRGDARGAEALLVDADDAALSSIVTHAALPWKARHGRLRGPAQRSGERWIFGFVGTHTHRDGRFERVRGKILVLVASSAKRARVSYFVIRNDDVRFSTHHDSVLLPSNR